MRIGGLASGMDIDKLVNDLMKAERMPVQKMEQDKTWLTWKRDAYREMNTLLLNFRSELTDMKMSTTFRARTTSSTNSDFVTATASSSASLSSYNVSGVSKLATAATQVNNDKAFTDPSTVDTSKSLFELKSDFVYGSFDWQYGSVKEKSISVNTKDTKVFSLGDTDIKDDPSAMSVKVGNKFYEVFTESTVPKDGSGNYVLNDDQVLIDTETGTLTFNKALDVNAEIKVKYTGDLQIDKLKTREDGKIQLSNQHINQNAALENQVAITIDGKAYITDGTNIVDKNDSTNIIGTIDYQNGTLSLNPEKIEKGLDVEVKYQYQYTSFRVGSYTEDGFKNEVFNIEASTSFDALVSEVNEADNGVNLFYDEVTGQMTLTRTETGNFRGSEFDPKATTEDYNGHEIVVSGQFATHQMRFNVAKETGGTDAHFTLNGLDTSRHSNSFEVSGVTFNLKQVFSDKDVKISINNDSEAVFENIKDFVEKYNELIDKVNEKLQEDRHRDYRPLTEKQREELSDRQQELWEEKAKSGLLKGDDLLSGALNDMRRDFYTPVNNGEISSMYQQLTSIGIETTENYLEGGKLEIDESKLKEAIQDNPEAVEKLFDGGSDSSYGQKGILHRLYQSVNETMDVIKGKAIDSDHTMGKRIDDLDDRIDVFENRLVQIEDRYWRQFTAMEQAIQRLNSQSMFISQQFSGGM
ncbi:flagellar filament capping protein FliD [Virgibacillus necropolis]|uniref:flagellar filament capping protein FliD n=1 Tax=Virgibacillus necropolis TaxID=163877 RepID=UPI00384AAD2C